MITWDGLTEEQLLFVLFYSSSLPCYTLISLMKLNGKTIIKGTFVFGFMYELYDWYLFLWPKLWLKQEVREYIWRKRFIPNCSKGENKLKDTSYRNRLNCFRLKKSPIRFIQQVTFLTWYDCSFPNKTRFAFTAPDSK